ncbi:MAG: tyrosine--tRNA ligase, partial [Gemmatimonadetes bacterium]|nr:tyrosine--tRNA ligase [Gemmatimonadota bacterium]
MTGKRAAHGAMGGFLEELAWRGLVHDQTPGLAERLRKGPITAYVGFDPTAPSLQVGNLVPVVLLEQLRRAGGTPIVLMGGGTGLIGDPSGKQTERPLLDQDLLRQNLAAQERQFGSLLPEGVVLNNATWLGNLTLVDFLRDVGKHFTISIMLQKESVKARLDEGISFTEFS